MHKPYISLLMLSIHSLDNMFAIMFTHYMYYMYSIFGKQISGYVPMQSWNFPKTYMSLYELP